jgi:type IX secretion system PorP/SprF family membrane protein
MNYRLSVFCGLLLCVAFSETHAQQRPLYSLYMTNQFLLNPALAGSGDKYDLRTGYRAQWMGFEEAPRTFYLSAHTYLGKTKRYIGDPVHFHGFGALVTNDQTGPLSVSNAYVNYTFNLGLSQTFRMAFGVRAGMQQTRLNGQSLRLSDPNSDLAGGFSEVAPDASAGIWLYSQRFYVGAALHQLFENKQEVNVASGMYELRLHYNLTAGVRIPVGDAWELGPSAMVNMVAPAPAAIDYNLKVRYMQQFWGGLSYRQSETLSAMLGLVVSRRFELAYAYDFPASNSLQAYHMGTHELMLGWRIGVDNDDFREGNFW